MNKIIFPLKQEMQGSSVGDLQTALQFFLDRGVILHDDDGTRKELSAALQLECSGQIYGKATRKLVSIFQDDRRLHPGEEGEVDEPTADALNGMLRELGALDTPQSEWVVRGQVMDANGPINDIQVSAFDRDLFFRPDMANTGQLLGTDITKRNPTTNEDGRFEITYSTEKFATGDAAPDGNLIPDLVFALSRDGKTLEKFQLYRLPDGKEAAEETLVSDDDLLLGIQARRMEEVRILIPGGEPKRQLSEYELLLQTLKPVLLERSPADMDEQNFRDITFAVRETGVEKEKVEFLVAAFNLAHDPFGNDLKPEVFYGLARTKGLTNLAGLACTSVVELRAALIRAGGLKERPEDNIMPPFESEEELDKAIDFIHRLSIERILITPLAKGKPSLAQILSTPLPSTEHQATLLREFVNRDGSVPEFWAKLRTHEDFAKGDKVKKVQFALQLGILTLNNVSLMNAMQSSERFQSTRDMARMEVAELTNFVKQGSWEGLNDLPGETKEEKLELYARGIIGLLQGAFPTETVAQYVSQVPDIHLNHVAPAVIAKFLNLATDTSVVKAGEEFDIRSTRIDTFLDKYGSKVFAGINGIGEDKEKQKLVTEQVKRAQRLFQVSTSPETFQELMKTKLSSAHDIAQMSLSAFYGEVSHNPVGAEEAELIHRRAMASSAKNLNLALRAYQSATDVYPAVTGSGLKEIPNWAQLFGSVEMCDCNHCNSVYSPAAYFVDLLQFLKLDKNEEGWTPLDVLIGNYDDPDPKKQLKGKRPDLPHIGLTCENTNTPIPYIDLVNEVLESYVAFEKLDQSTAKDTGASTAAELSANPQYVEDEAYNKIRDAFFPVGLPFDRPLEVARLYLEQLGASRHDVMQAFAKNDAESLALASEKLGISSREFEILTGRDFGGNTSPIKLNDLFGFLADADTWAEQADIKPHAVGALITGVPEFLHRTGLSYLELVDLLKTRFINPNQVALQKLENTGITYQEVRDLIQNGYANPGKALQDKLTQSGLTLTDAKQLIEELLRTIVLYSEKSECELSSTLIQYLQVDQTNGGASLDDTDSWKLQRFIRLWRKLGWTMQELDTVLLSLGYADGINGECIQKLAWFKELEAELKLPIVQLLSIWANINTHGDKALYNTLFQNKAVLNPPDPDFRLDTTQDELAVTTWDLADKYPLILAALRLRASDLDAIVEDAKLQNGKVTLANLSALYRYAVLAKALQISVKDLIKLRVLGGNSLDPFTDKNPGPTLYFIDLVRKVKKFGFLVPQLAYIYCHQFSLPTSLPPQQVSVGETFKALHDGLNRIASDNTLESDPIGDITRAKLALLFENTTVDAIVQMIDGSAVYGEPLEALPAGVRFPDSLPALLKNKIRYEARNLRFVGTMTDMQCDNDLLPLSGDDNYQAAIKKLHQQPRDLIKSAFAGFLSLNDAEAVLLNQPSLDPDGKPIYLDQAGNPVADPSRAVTTAVAFKFNFFLDKFLPYLRDTLSRSLIKQFLSQALAVDNGVIKLLLENEKVLHAKDSKVAIIADFLALNGLAASSATAVASYERLHKIAMLVNTFKLSAPEIEYWHSTDFVGLDLNSLPLTATDTAIRFEQWQKLADYISFRDSLPDGVMGMIDVFKTEDSLKSGKLTDLTGWRKSDIQDAIDILGLQNRDLNTLTNLLKVQRIIELGRRLGLNVKQLNEWATNPPNAAQAREIKNALKAKYDEETWLQVSKPLSDKLRESQKAALIAYVLARPEIRKANVTDSNQLFEYFLIDVEMGACMVTSRIKQAISSVQLFVQRCLLNLEPGVRPSAIDAHRWEWMKNYRVWEANRKVFLYPENWIEPELRDDKTPFFKQMESELLQNDVTNETAEKALLNYLYKLDQVARLEVCGMYLQEDFEPWEEYQSILHVFARTMGGMTHSYYYRRLIDNKTWTSWEKVELDIHCIQGSDEGFSDGIHLMPFVWNRRLYLFWLVFTRKAESVEPPQKIELPQSMPQQPKPYWEIKLAWSKYDQGKWTPKQISVNGKDVFRMDPKDYRLRALLTDTGLSLNIAELSIYITELIYINDLNIGRFSLADDHGEVGVLPASGYISEIRPVPTWNANYMGYRNGSQLNLEISTDKNVPILGTTPGYNLLPLNQNYPQPLQAPYFYQDEAGVYFIRSREVIEEIVRQVEVPDSVGMLHFDDVAAIEKYDVRHDLGIPDDRLIETKVANPWVLAEHELSSRKIQKICTQSGLKP